MRDASLMPRFCRESNRNPLCCSEINIYAQLSPPRLSRKRICPMLCFSPRIFALDSDWWQRLHSNLCD